jgi:hypothetical protein
MQLPDFQLEKGPNSERFIEKGIFTFKEACNYIQKLPYGRTSDRTNNSLILAEGKGTCSSKHGLLASLTEENNQLEIELIAGIFMMSPATHPQLTNYFKDKNFTYIPEMHCFFRYKGKRFDFTSSTNRLEFIEPKLVREQRCEPHQVGEWKEMIHKEYMNKWIGRNLSLGLTFDQVWKHREVCIGLLSE